MIASIRELCGSVRLGGKSPKSVWWNNEVKTVVRREEVLAANNEEAKERCMEAYRRKEKG